MKAITIDSWVIVHNFILTQARLHKQSTSSRNFINNVYMAMNFFRVCINATFIVGQTFEMQ